MKLDQWGYCRVCKAYMCEEDHDLIYALKQIDDKLLKIIEILRKYDMVSEKGK